jgi:predicted outer membrane repeat protein
MLLIPRAKPARTLIDVYPGEDIQSALEAAAARPSQFIVRLHAGVYRPSRPGQALVYFNERHDGVVLEGVGEVILTAANPDLADRSSRSYPAIVNHVVYFGDMLSRDTILRNVKITGANEFVDGPPGLLHVKTPEDLNQSTKFRTFESPIESAKNLVKTHEFFCDGGGILVYGRSYPTIENVEIYGNHSSVCGGGVSVQHHIDVLACPVQFKNCVFRDNRAAVSGGAIDVFSRGSWVALENCLFVGNASDENLDFTKDHGYGALSVFPMCRVTARYCTFTGNRSAVDDRGNGSEYHNSIFWKNTQPGGVVQKRRYEIDLAEPGDVRNCFLHGAINDLRRTVPRDTNQFDPPDPDFDTEFNPRNPLYRDAGYRSTRGPADTASR